MKLFAVCLSIVSVCMAIAFGSAQQPFTIAISMDNPEVKAGSDIWIKIEMTNTSNHDIECSVAAVNGVDRRFQYSVSKPDGTPAKRIVSKHPELEGAGSVKLCTLEPGGTAKTESLISRLFDMTAPGKYSVRALRGVSDKESDGSAQSNTLVVTVTP